MAYSQQADQLQKLPPMACPKDVVEQVIRLILHHLVGALSAGRTLGLVGFDSAQQDFCQR
jgi:hypothetical protein